MKSSKRSTWRGPRAFLTAAVACLATISVAHPQEAKKPTEDKKAAEKKPDENKPADSAVTVWSGAVVQDLAYDAYVSSFLDVDGSLGAQVVPADNALRAQLGLPKDQGLVVTSVRDGGPAEKAGLQKHDVLLTVGGKPLGNSDALRQRLQESGEKRLPLTLLRGGKKLTIEVTPLAGTKWDVTVFRNDGSGVWIGVSVAASDETLRAQLRLPAKRGLVVTKVEADAPAAKAGILVHDVLVEFGGKPLGTIEDLNTQIQEVGEKPATMKLLRSGQAQSLQVTPLRRTGELPWKSNFPITNIQSVRGWESVYPRVIQPYALPDQANQIWATPAARRDARAELADLVKEVRKLNERIEALHRSLTAAEEKAAKETPKQK